ncbi:Hypothetical predicted protein [Pelobates cultripes]|uniref:Uncharacterized protein n=1 Tax=Pelobates cultripes TaxID=61616 RepID=A0AAD1WB39_PELCU|nr:Hypothetical predicted protein [Pelobates cultripes]
MKRALSKEKKTNNLANGKMENEPKTFFTRLEKRKSLTIIKDVCQTASRINK